MDLLKAALAARANAHAPYSGFKVGAAIRCPDGSVFAGCNVENVAYPQGTCAEAGAIAAMVAAGQRTIAEVLVVATGPQTIAPCGGCRQKLAEFAAERDAGGPRRARRRASAHHGRRAAARGLRAVALRGGLMLVKELIARKRDGGRLSAERDRLRGRGADRRARHRGTGGRLRDGGASCAAWTPPSGWR